MWHKVPVAAAVFVHVTSPCTCTAGPSPLRELQWALTWPLNTGPLQWQGQELMPHRCQSRLVNEQLLSRTFREDLCVQHVCLYALHDLLSQLWHLALLEHSGCFGRDCVNISIKFSG